MISLYTLLSLIFIRPCISFVLVVVVFMCVVNPLSYYITPLCSTILMGNMHRPALHYPAAAFSFSSLSLSLSHTHTHTHTHVFQTAAESAVFYAELGVRVWSYKGVWFYWIGDVMMVFYSIHCIERICMYGLAMRRPFWS
jgi:hypothetical protein